MGRGGSRVRWHTEEGPVLEARVMVAPWRRGEERAMTMHTYFDKI